MKAPGRRAALVRHRIEPSRMPRAPIPRTSKSARLGRSPASDDALDMVHFSKTPVARPINAKPQQHGPENVSVAQK